MSKEQNRDVCMYVQVEKSPYGSDAFYVTARPVYRMYEGGQWMPRFFVESIVATDQENVLADLQVHAQGDINPRELGGDVYGWKVRYFDVYSVDLARAAVMVKLLRRVERGLERIDRQLGRAESFTAYIARVATVLGAESFGFQDLHDRGHYVWHDAPMLRGAVDARIRKIREAAVGVGV